MIASRSGGMGDGPNPHAIFILSALLIIFFLLIFQLQMDKARGDFPEDASMKPVTTKEVRNALLDRQRQDKTKKRNNRQVY